MSHRPPPPSRPTGGREDYYSRDRDRHLPSRPTGSSNYNRRSRSPDSRRNARGGDYRRGGGDDRDHDRSRRGPYDGDSSYQGRGYVPPPREDGRGYVPPPREGGRGYVPPPRDDRSRRRDDDRPDGRYDESTAGSSRDRYAAREMGADRERDRDRDANRRGDDRDAHSSRNKASNREEVQAADDEDGSVEEEQEAGPTADEDMMAAMGFGGFGTTKNHKVDGNASGGANVKKERTWRQYMNRKGGFNRPLDALKK
ncbi:unnamed protein product [Sympodiomycopsis kandeliae]